LADLGQVVKEARKELALTQEEAAALCGVSMPFLNQLEGAKRAHLSITKVLNVCAGLGVRLFAGGATARPGTGMLSIQGLAPSVVIRNREGQVIDPATGNPRKVSNANESSD
jgi:transcriptional regulator with XRE-family HTH domain